MVKIWERARKRSAKTSKCLLLQPASSQALSPSNKDPNEMLQEKPTAGGGKEVGEPEPREEAGVEGRDLSLSPSCLGIRETPN